jgi:predicted permease
MDADVYLPLKTIAGLDGYTMEARLKPGISHHVAEQQMQPLITQFEKETPIHFPPKPGRLAVIGLNEQFLAAIGPSLAMLFGAVLLLLAIGCGNVSILLLARGTVREHEFAVRAAIGATRSRIVRQLLTEALLLSLTGAALGVLLAYKLVAVIVGLLPEFSFPHEAAIAINLPVLLFCVAVSLLTGVLFGLSPALRLSRPDVRDAMQSGTRSVAGKASSRALYNTLIGGQIALTLLLLSAAGEAIQGFMKMSHMRLGYDPHNVMSVGLPLQAASYDNVAARGAFVEQITEKIAAVRGVKAVAISTNATPPSNGFEMPMNILGLPAEDRKIRINLVNEGYFPLLRIPLRQGRLWTADETHNGAKLAVINETFARKYFPRGDALGHSVSVPIFKPQPPQLLTTPGADGWLQIVGVVEDKLDDGLSHPILPEIFLPYTIAMPPFTQVLVRTEGPPLSLLHTIGVQVASVDHNQQISGQVRDLEHWISREPEYARGQLISWLFGAFAVLALMLAAVGLYSLVSYTVARRTNEFGIRMALGAMRSHVLGLVLQSTVVSVVSGVVAGSVCAVLLHRLMTHLVPQGPQAYAALLPAIGLLALVALLASGIPAVRAANIEPMKAVRYE